VRLSKLNISLQPLWRVFVTALLAQSVTIGNTPVNVADLAHAPFWATVASSALAAVAAAVLRVAVPQPVDAPNVAVQGVEAKPTV